MGFSKEYEVDLFLARSKLIEAFDLYSEVGGLACINENIVQYNGHFNPLVFD